MIFAIFMCERAQLQIFLAVLLVPQWKLWQKLTDGPPEVSDECSCFWNTLWTASQKVKTSVSLR